MIKHANKSKAMNPDPHEIIGVYYLQTEAVRYARSNTEIIPLIPDQKLPILKRWWERATFDEELVKFLWDIGPYNPESILKKINAPIFQMMFECKTKDKQRESLREALLKEADLDRLRNPNYNIGIATGTANGITVFDIDNKPILDGKSGTDNWRILQTILGRFFGDLEAITPSQGRHVYCSLDSRFQTASNVFSEYPGIDVRNNGGLIVAPPSKILVDHGYECEFVRYRWKNQEEVYDLKPFLKPVPDQLVRLLAEQTSKTKGVRKSKPNQNLQDQRLIKSNLKSCIQNILNDHPGVTKGSRNDQALAVCRKLAGRFRTLSEEEMMEALEAWNETCDPPLKEMDLIRKLQSTLRRRVSDEENGIEWSKPTSGRKRITRRRRRIVVDVKERPLVRLPKDMHPQPEATVKEAIEVIQYLVPPTIQFASLAARYLIHRFVGLTDEERLTAMEKWHSLQAVPEETRQLFKKTLGKIRKLDRSVRVAEIKKKRQVADLA